MTIPIFVTGTDTDIGKTFVSGLLVKKWGCDYWKPVQTGLNCDPGDTFTVKKLLTESGGIPETTTVHQPALEYQMPLSPWRCTVLEKENSIEISEIKLPKSLNDYMIVEGAGGILVPLAKDIYTTDLITKLGAKVIVVARSELGTINHTLLTLEVLKERKIDVIGVILNGNINADNALALRETGVEILAEIPRVGNLSEAVDLIPDISHII